MGWVGRVGMPASAGPRGRGRVWRETGSQLTGGEGEARVRLCKSVRKGREGGGDGGVSGSGGDVRTLMSEAWPRMADWPVPGWWIMVRE
eukprot:scaffold26868_cov64-Isochrysis_galbana.AAC.2